MGKLIKGFLKKLLLILPLKKQIVFESSPDLSDNTRAVFDEMIRRNLNKKYKMVWFCYDDVKTEYPKTKNVKLLYRGGHIRAYYLARSKVLICCNRFLPPLNEKQFSINLSHGTGIKQVKNYYLQPQTIKYRLVQSENRKREILEKRRDICPDSILPFGFPRNDVLTKTPLDLHIYFKTDYKKIIVWYPTVRQFKNSTRKLTNSEHALPVIWDSEKAVELNCFAKENDILIVLKPHFAQDVSYVKELSLSNIVFIDDTFFKRSGIASYRFVGSCDALLTDFSSIYFDYTLCDKPIGLIWEDYEEFKQNPGFAIDMEKMMKGGVKIYNLVDLKSFIKDVADGIDTLKEDRRKVRDYINYSNDGKSSERVVDFIIKNAGLL